MKKGVKFICSMVLVTLIFIANNQQVSANPGGNIIGSISTTDVTLEIQSANNN